MSARYRQQLEATESDEWQQDLPRYSEAGSDSETLEEAIDDTLMAQVIPERRRYARIQLNNFSSPFRIKSHGLPVFESCHSFDRTFSVLHLF